MTAAEAAIRAYVAEVSGASAAGNATEHSYRGFLQRLLEALLPAGWRAVNEPKRCECGAPDYAILAKGGAAVAWVEAKDVGDGDLDGGRKTGHKEQFDRYKAALDTVVFTDYLDFRLYVNGAFAKAARIGVLQPDGRARPAPEGFAAFLEIIDAIATASPRRIDGAKALAAAMAAKARMLQIAAHRFLSSGEGSSQLFDLLRGFRDMLVPDIGEEEFSDIFAQTVTYGLFAARLRDPSPESFSREEAAALIPKSNPFLRQLFFYIQMNLEKELEWAVDDLVDLYRAADVGGIMRDYGAAQGGADPMIHFYEDFLAAYDAGLRKDRGVWYTPLPVVKFIVRAVDWTLRERFGLPDGLADASRTQIEVEEDVQEGKKTVSRKVAKTVHRVQLLDPATGTGTFLAECARFVRERVCAANAGMWPDYARNDLVPRLNGFELLMASYTMAHIKMDFALGGGGNGVGAGERFRIFLTDSLSDWHRELPGGLFAAALAREQSGADEIKRDIPVMVVLGNPPYSGESQNKGEWITRLMEDYKTEPGGKAKLQERNPKWINDDYVKFIRLAQRYVEKNGSGVVAFITPHGFLDNPTFRGMRWRLMQTFDELWFLNLHGNAKKKETAPDGGKDDNVFDIMQGVCISIMVKTPEAKAALCCVHYADVWGRRKDKFALLENKQMDDVAWQTLAPAEPMLFFVPRDTQGEEEYNKGFSIKELFGINSVGIATANDKTLVGFKADELQRQVDSAFPGEYDGGKVGSYAYRPFDIRLLYHDIEKIERPRSQVMRHFLRGENVGLVMKKGFPHPEERAIGFVSESISDFRFWSCSGMQGGDYVFPLYLYEEALGGEGGCERRANLDAKVVSRIAAAAGAAALEPQDAFDYVYGVLHSPGYRRKFREFLKTDFPRVPYPKGAEDFARYRDAGRALRRAHLLQDAPPGLADTMAAFPVAGGNVVDCARYEAGRVYINDAQFFDNVPEGAWCHFIGGYQPAQKWLKDRKGRRLSGDDVRHYRRIVAALVRTRAIMEALP